MGGQVSKINDVKKLVELTMRIRHYKSQLVGLNAGLEQATNEMEKLAVVLATVKYVEVGGDHYRVTPKKEVEKLTFE